MRIRGEISSTNAIDSWVIGIRVFNESSLATLTTTQGPIASPYDDWMVRLPHLPKTDGINYMSLDGQAARKMEELGQGLVLAFDAITATTFNYDLSIGLKLP
jgi:hypothetical protein